MSKKQKRQYSRRNEAYTPQASSAESAGSKVARRTASAMTEFNPDYTDIKAGLKRIGVLAASFIGILIILSFILPR